MADQFQIIPYKVRSAGTDVPPEEIQTAINSLAQQTTVALNSVASDPTGPAGGDLGGTYPNPTVVGSHIVSGTINGASVGATTPSTGAFTTLTATTPVGVTSGGTGLNALTAHAVVIGEGSSAPNFAGPGTTGQMLLGVTGADPAFGNNPTITGGSINSTPVGATTPSTGAFTTLTATTPVGVASGGTGRATLLAHGVLVGEGTAGINQLAVGNTGQMLLGSSGADPGFGNNPAITGGTVDGAPVGATTPSTGAFTTLAASGAVSGAGFTARFASPGPIGNTAASTGAFTTVTATGTITPSSTNGIVGTTAADNANAGSIGEIISATFTTLNITTSNTNQNFASISLTAGDWDVQAHALFQTGAGATMTAEVIGISATSVTLPTAGNYWQSNATVTGTAAQSGIAPVQRESLSGSATIFLVGLATFAGGTANVSGFIRARRVR